ncbi:MAG: EAL domain-containing protein [Parvularculaceae bacterium]
MLAVTAMDVSGASALDAATAFDLVRGAILGAIVMAAAFFTGLAVFRRGSTAVCALLMVVSAGILQLDGLRFINIASHDIVVLLQGVFGASAIVFLSAVIRMARNNALLGGLMFAAALTFVGLGVINLVAKGDASGLMRIGLVGVGLVAVLLAIFQSPRDHGARLILPGAVLALAAPIVIYFFGGSQVFTLASHSLFTIGILTASLVVLNDGAPARSQDLGLHGCGADAFPSAAHDHHESSEHDEQLRVSENQLAQVLDYTGVAVWDWCPHGAHQTEGLSHLMGADSGALFTPEALRDFVHKEDLEKFERRVVATGEGDGAFDVVLKLHDGRHIRLRGARAVDAGGTLERIVAFAEGVTESMRSAKPVGAPAREQDGKFAASTPLAGAFAGALEKGLIATVFQPIVDLETGNVAGYEALARWRGEKGGPDRASAEELVRAAEAAGRGGNLARHVLQAAASHLGAQIKAQQNRGLFVAMNMSFSQMREPGFTEAIRKAMVQHGLPAKALVLELTESQAITDEGAASEAFRKLKGSGAALSFDDFGAGFSSLSNLQKFAFDYLKIDKSFIEALTRNGEGAKIARAVAGLGRDLGLTVIAEGVESKETAEAARAIGCALGQGFEFGSPEASNVARENAARNSASDRQQQRRRMFAKQFA